MWAELKYDICGVQTTPQIGPFNKDVPGIDRLLEQAVSETLSYSAQYWARHVMECVEDRVVLEQLLRFFENQLLRSTLTL